MRADIDRKFLLVAYQEAKAGFDEGGCPISAVLARGQTLVSQGRNQRVQGGDPVAHGVMDALRGSGRQTGYPGTTHCTSLSPGMVCQGAIVRFGIPRVAIAENTTFGGNEEFLRARRRARHCRRPGLHRADDAIYKGEAGALVRGHRGRVRRLLEAAL